MFCFVFSQGRDCKIQIFEGKFKEVKSHQEVLQFTTDIWKSHPIATNGSCYDWQASRHHSDTANLGHWIQTQSQTGSVVFNVWERSNERACLWTVGGKGATRTEGARVFLRFQQREVAVGLIAWKLTRSWWAALTNAPCFVIEKLFLN